MRNLLRAAFLLVALLAVKGAFAQTVVLFGVDGLKLGDYPQGMALANSFSMGFVDNTTTVQSTTAAGTASRGTVPGQRSIQDIVLTLPTGNATIMLSRAVMAGTLLPRATVQIVQANKTQNAPIFQVMVYDVLVTSVVMGKSGNDGGPGFTEVKLKGSRYDMFNNNQDPRGAMSPGAKAAIDVRAGKVY